MNRSLKFAFVCAVTFATPSALLACSSVGNPDASPTCPTLVIPDTCPSPPPSWKTDVQPLFAKYCYPCHTAGGVGQTTKNFSTFQSILTAHLTIASQVSNCIMPLADAGQPTAAERETIVTWASTCGAPNN